MSLVCEIWDTVTVKVIYIQMNLLICLNEPLIKHFINLLKV